MWKKISAEILQANMLRHETTRLINGGALQASDKMKKVTCIMYLYS